MKTRRIGILTGGGDVPGLNSVIKSVVYRSREAGWEVVGIRKGWEGLTHGRPGTEAEGEYARRLTRENTRTVDRTGGTMLHTSRLDPQRVKEERLPPHLASGAEKYRREDGRFDLVPVVLDNLERLGVDCLIVIGGDGTLSATSRLAREGVPLVAIPKTMDNDVAGTEYCLGFSTAITRAKDLVTRQRTTLGSHERIGVFRIFGRDSGFTALHTGYVTSGRCVIPEHPFDLDRLAQLMLSDKENNPSRYAFVIAAEGATWEGRDAAREVARDADGRRHRPDIGQALCTELQRITGQDTMHSDLTYDLRSGNPDALDQTVATTFANIALDLIADGVTGRMVAVQGGRYAHVDLPDREQGSRQVDVHGLYDVERYRPRYVGKLGTPLLLS
ncbi:MAG TPA: 6-phosphofructokinase [Thermoanaerobaculia bacterium]|jgi:6-phosphofructokinase 1|nr:6-phosphofructokinase [Thermoanaerobaculia bacterium]